MLLLTSVFIKFIGAVYKIPLTAYIGAVGRGYFATAYNLYLPIHAVIMGAMPVAMSRLVSKYSARGDLNTVSSLRKGAMSLFLVAGSVATLVLIFAAKPYSVYIASSPKSVYTVWALAPSILLCCIAAMYRGYYEGMLDMKPTSVSQTVEALFKAVIGLAFAKLCVMYLSGNKSDVYPFSSAAAMSGATLGSLVSLIYVMLYDKKHKCTLPKTTGRDGRRELFSFSLPILISCCVQSVFQFLDTATVQYSLKSVPRESLFNVYREALDFSGTSPSDSVTYVWGLFSASLDFKNLIPGITMALGVCAVPAICSEYENKNRIKTQKLINSILTYTSVLSLFLGCIIAICSKELLTMFYGKGAGDVVIGCNSLVKYFAVTAPLYSLASVAVFTVQALGKPEKSIMPYVASGIIRCALNIRLVSDSDYILGGAVIAGALGYLCMFLMNLRIIKNVSGTKISYLNTVVKPLISALIGCFSVNIIQVYINFSRNIFVNFLIKTTVFSSLYCILCFFLKVFDFKEIFSVLNFKKNGLNT